MLFLRWIGWLISLPLLWAGQLAAMLQQPLSLSLFQAAWFLGGDPRVAVSILAQTQRQGAAAALELADRWLVHRPLSQIAAFAGLLALQAGDVDRARRYLQQAQALDPDPDGRTELLALAMAECSGDSEATLKIARDWEDRNDLSAEVRLMVCNELLWDAMFHERLEEVERRAEHLWSISDNPLAAAAFWALAKRRGEEHSAARRYWSRIKLPPPQAAFYRILGSIAVGTPAEARLLLPKLRELDAHLAVRAEVLLAKKEAA
ncbi:MAG: hypothetical protein ABSG68_14360 [Thermoguttaceae bacterium]|jgi:tetratricopeptide (TPR) repeat protein